MIKLIKRLLGKSRKIVEFPPDGDISILKVTNSSGRWKYIKICSECMEEVSHQERMTDICLSCGRRMRSWNNSASIRPFIYNRKWTVHMHYKNKDYVKDNGSWILVEKPKGS